MGDQPTTVGICLDFFGFLADNFVDVFTYLPKVVWISHRIFLRESLWEIN